jgi:hypothetical protein
MIWNVLWNAVNIVYLLHFMKNRIISRHKAIILGGITKSYYKIIFSSSSSSSSFNENLWKREKFTTAVNKEIEYLFIRGLLKNN